MIRIICTVTNDLTFDQRMIRICSSLAAAGYSVELIGRELPDSRTLVEQSFQQKRFRLWFSKGKLFYLEYNFRLFWYLLFSKFDVICAVDLDTLMPGFLVSKLREKKLVYDAHEYFTEVPEVIERPLVKKSWEFVARLLIPRVQYAYTVCDSLAEVFYERYGCRFSVIRNVPFYQHLSVKARVPGGPFILLYQGALNDGRGLEEAIGAMARLENTELWLAGEGDLSGKLRTLATRLKVENKIRFLGRVPPGELASLTLKAQLGLNLLKNKGLNYYYSLANKAFDYIQAGIPSLSMNFPEYQRLNQEQCVFFLLEKLEVEAIVRAVQQLREDANLYGKLSVNCLKAKETLNWEQEEKKLLDFYENVLGKD